MPTDTIYGLSASALDKDAVERIHSIKGRDSSKPLIVLIANLEMLDLLSIYKEQAKIIEEYWPGAVSLEFNASDSPSWLHRGRGHFAIRMPDHDTLRELISQVGPIVSTSANIQGGEPASNLDQAQAIFGEKLDFYVDAGKLVGQSSTLVINEGGRLKVVREGAVKIKQRSKYGL